MDRCDFSSIMTCLKNHISESNQMSQPEFLYEVFEDFIQTVHRHTFAVELAAKLLENGILPPKQLLEKGILLLEQYKLLYTNDSIPQINNYAALLTEMQEPERAMSALQKLAQIIKDYNFDHCLDYAQVQEAMGNICLITANIS